MKPISTFKTLFYTGITICVTPILIVVVMVLFGNSTPATEIKKEISVFDSIIPVPIKPEAKVIIDTTTPVVAKPKKKIKTVM